MRRYRAYNLSLASDFPLFEFPPSMKETDVEIVRGEISAPPLLPTSILRHDIEATFGGGLETATIRWPGIATLQALSGRVLRVEPVTTDAVVLSAYISSEALGLILCQRGLFLLHASAVVIRGGAVVLVGSPGAGKSTLAAACAQRGHVVLSDDMVALELAGGEGPPLVLPGSPQVSAWPDAIEALGSSPELHAPSAPNCAKRLFHHPAGSHPDPVPLRHIVFVEPGDSLLFERSRPTAAILGLTRYFPCPAALLDGAAQRRRLSECQNLCNRTPTWRLTRPRQFAGLQGTVDHLEQRCGPEPG